MAKDGYLEKQRIILVGEVLGRTTGDIEDFFEENEYLSLTTRHSARPPRQRLKGNDPIVSRIARYEGVLATIMVARRMCCYVNERPFYRR